MQQKEKKGKELLKFILCKYFGGKVDIKSILSSTFLFLSLSPSLISLRHTDHILILYIFPEAEEFKSHPQLHKGSKRIMMSLYKSCTCLKLSKLFFF